jgi:energy-coupling factor transporter ATP-binding protein EcfA2
VEHVQRGRTIALIGDSGSGKTTQAGEYAKHVFKTRQRRTLYYGADAGGYDAIQHLCELNIVTPITFTSADDPWIWSEAAVSGKHVDSEQDIGLVIFDSGSSLGELLLNSCGKMAAEGQEIGGRKAPGFRIRTPSGEQIKFGSNSDSHYFVVQNHMRDMINRSTYLTENGIDVLWTFALDRGERPDQTPILGPLVVGHALTKSVARWFKYTFPLMTISVHGSEPRHVMYIQEQPDTIGLSTVVSNARYPLDASTPLPATIEPASITRAIELIERGKEEAVAAVKQELGL